MKEHRRRSSSRSNSEANGGREGRRTRGETAGGGKVEGGRGRRGVRAKVDRNAAREEERLGWLDWMVPGEVRG